MSRLPRWTGVYRAHVRSLAARLGSDGCTGVPDFFRDACLEHDIAYRTGKTVDGVPLTRARADAIFRRRIQTDSWFGRLSPMSWWRWAGVRFLGGSSWRGSPKS